MSFPRAGGGSPADRLQVGEHLLEHSGAGFGDTTLRSLIVRTPPLVVAALGGAFSMCWVRTALPITAGLSAGLPPGDPNARAGNGSDRQS